jgi:glucose/arabinose dehydrogenase
MGTKVIIALLLVVLFSACSSPVEVEEQEGVDEKIHMSIQAESELPFITLPSGFSISIFAEGLGSPRLMAFNEGTLFATIPSTGTVVALPDEDGNGKADRVHVVVDSLNRPHGIAFFNNRLYIAETDKVSRFLLDKDGTPRADTKEILIDNLPTLGHWTKTIKIHDNKLYLAMGSSCNVCHEDDERRAAITQCESDGTGCKVFAKGLRNAVGFIFVDSFLYATDNGRDWLGPDLPPEEVNIVQEGRDYGWPICYGNKIHDTEFDDNQYIRDPCEDTATPVVEMQAHSAPLGLAYYKGQAWPEDYRNSLFVAFHGSWNRVEKTGYKVVRIDLDDAQLRAEDFAAGWLKDGDVSGRPVDVVFDDKENMYISDDNAGKIYRVSYAIKGS